MMQQNAQILTTYYTNFKKTSNLITHTNLCSDVVHENVVMDFLANQMDNVLSSSDLKWEVEKWNKKNRIKYDELNKRFRQKTTDQTNNTT